MLLAVLCLLALAPGTYTAWRVHHRHGWAWAIAAGTAVTVGLACGLLVSLIVMAPLAILAATGSILAALRAYDRGRVFVASAWTGVASVCLWCAGIAWPGWTR
ncbi:hypothetical protein [Streptomyces sp. NPDC002952]|uniref:hypothetical protein n=1 Tax=Streptomyces sp. NPDC002952 TaxID=3364673 RepID=UPI003677B783